MIEQLTSLFSRCKAIGKLADNFYSIFWLWIKKWLERFCQYMVKEIDVEIVFLD